MSQDLKVVTAQEMKRIEGLAFAQGASELTFMENAAQAIAEIISDYIDSRDLERTVTLLVGKGNNAGDVLCAGADLLERGLSVSAWSIYPAESWGPLCKTMAERFQAKGGKIYDTDLLPNEGVILDGLVGTGFAGKAEGPLAHAIERANASGLPIVAVDIPSGLNGSTGEVATIAIHAALTIFLELPKLGFFLKQGWDHVGELALALFGLADEFKSAALAAADLFNSERLLKLLPAIQRTRHKYQSGYVLAVGGSPSMPGAPMLASMGALRSGAGIVRLFHPEGMEALLANAPYEVIREGWDGKNTEHIQTEAKRARALLMGPGMGRTPEAHKACKAVLQALSLPTVLDADALYWLAQDPKLPLSAQTILTPHQREMEALLAGATPNLENCQKFAEQKKVTLVLKGAPTIVFHPGTLPLIITRGDPGMATAGTGDVLTGVIAAMLAQGLPARQAASVAVALHGIAGELAAAELTSYCLIASDLLKFLPEAFQSLSVDF